MVTLDARARTFHNVLYIGLVCENLDYIFVMMQIHCRYLSRQSKGFTVYSGGSSEGETGERTGSQHGGAWCEGVDQDMVIILIDQWCLRQWKESCW